MQNRYVGDIGDFGKLGMLRAISETGLSIGVNWYLTPNEDHNGDGRNVRYLLNENYRACDESLWRVLGHIVNSGQRQVSALERADILKAVYYSKELDFKHKSKSERAVCLEQWHAAALACIGGCDIVFADPDNGLLVPSAEGKVKSNKFVTTSLRYYFFILQPRHKEIISDRIRQMLKTPWREHFRMI